MSIGAGEGRLRGIVDDLISLPDEQTWLEFKVNNADPTEIGEYISALANSAALGTHPKAYMVWGVADAEHEVVGTTFDPATKKVGSEDLYHWLLRGLSPEHKFRFDELAIDDMRVVLMTVEPALSRPVQFQGNEWIRIGSYKKKLKDHPDHERRLWQQFEALTYEAGEARGGLTNETVLEYLDYPSYFSLARLPLPENRSAILERFVDLGFIGHHGDEWFITNMGGLLFARNLDDFPNLSRKAPRVIQYRGNSRVATIREQVGQRGYASGFQGLFQYISGLLPETEVIDEALRRSDLLYPDLAVRELVANALIHQDLTMRGSGPMIEIFDDRMEITNPGVPLIDVLRFLDSPPRSRNESLAKALRMLGICEERGSGWDKVVFEVEYHQLPAPSIEVIEDHTKVTLLAPQPLTKMNRDDRVQAVYLHACLRYVNRQKTTNSSIRERFGIDDRNSASASRLIREAVDLGAIVPHDPTAGPRSLHYVPFWADPRRGTDSLS